MGKIIPVPKYALPICRFFLTFNVFLFFLHPWFLLFCFLFYSYFVFGFLFFSPPPPFSWAILNLSLTILLFLFWTITGKIIT